jgi:fibronectin-binding autotransporter adhesin
MYFASKHKKTKFYSVAGVFILFSSIFFSLIPPVHVSAASYTWDGGGTDGTCGGAAGDGNKWSCAANWSSDIVPAAGDNVTFNGTSTKNATIDASFQGTVASLTISSGYTGTITQARSFTINGAFSQSDGTYTAANQTLTISTFTLNSGSNFTASSGTMSVGANFTVTGGTFNHNNGTVIFSPGTATLSCNNIAFNLVSFTHTLNVTKTVNSDCSLPMGNNPASFAGSLIINGTLSGSGTLTNTGSIFTLASTGSLSGFSTLSLGTFTNNGGTITGTTSITATSIIIAGTWNASSYTTFTTSAFTLNTGGNFTAPATMSVGTNFTVTGGTFNHNNGTVIFSPGTATLSCNNITFNLVSFTHTTNVVKTVNSDCSLPMGNNPASFTGSIILNGTISGTGTFTNNATAFTFASTATLSGFSTLSFGTFTNNGGTITGATSFTATSLIIAGTWNAGSYTTFTTSTFTLNTGGNFTAPASMSVGGNFTVTGGTFNHNNGTVIFSPGTATLSCNNIAFNLVSFTHTLNVTKTVNSDCSLPMGNNPASFSGSLIINGTLSGSGTLTNTGSIFTLNSGSALTGFSSIVTGIFTNNGGSTGSATSLVTGSITVAGAWNAGSFTTFTDSGTFILNSGAVFTAPSATMSVSSTFTINSGATFTHNNGTINFNGTTTAILSCNAASFNAVTFTHTSGTKTVSSNCTFPSTTVNASGGSLVVNGSVTGTGTVVLANLTLAAGSTYSGFTGLTVSTLTSVSTTLDTTSYTTFSPTALTLGATGNITMPSTGTSTITTLTLVSGSVFTGGTGNITINNAFTLPSGATFTASSGTTKYLASFTINAGSTFNHNNGIVNFSGNNPTLSCNNVTFNLVQLTQTPNGMTVSSNCTLPLGNNPELGGAASDLTLYGTLTGTGTATKGGVQLILQSGAVLSGFTGLSGSLITNNGANLGSITSYSSGTTIIGGTWNASSYTNFSPGVLTLNSGANLTAPSVGMTIGGAFVMNTGATFNGGTATNTFNSTFTLNGGTYNATSGTSNYASTFTISGGTFNHNNGIVNFSGTTAATLSCNNTTFNSVTFTNTIGAKTVSSNCTLPIGTNPTTGPITLNGTLTGTGTLTANGVFTMNTGSALSCFTAVNASPFIYNGGTICGGTAITWDGGGTDGTCGGNAGDGNKWSCAYNWLTDTVPTTLQPVVFDGTSTKNAVIDSAFQGTVLNITINSGYTGVITQQRSFSTLGNYVQSDGTFTSSSYGMTINSLTLNSGATLNATSSTLIVGGDFTLNSGSTFNHNNGTVNFTGTASATLSCNSSTFHNIAFTHTTGTKTVSANCNLPVGNNPTFDAGSISLSGTMSGTGTLTMIGALTLNSGANFSGFTNISTGAFTTSANLDATTWNTFTVTGAFTLNSPATFTAPSTLNVSGNFTINSGSTFNHNNGTVVFNGSTATVNCNNAAFNLVRITTSQGGVITVNSNCSLPLGNNPTIGTISYNSNGSITSSGLTLNGTLTGTGTLTTATAPSTTTAPFSFGTTASLVGFTGFVGPGTISVSGNWNASTYTTFQTGKSFTVNSGATFTAPANMNINGDLTLNASSTFNHNNGTINFGGTSATITCNSKTLYSVTFSSTAGMKTIASSCTLPLGSNPAFPAGVNMTLNGTLTGSGSLTFGGKFIMNTGSVLNCFSSISANPFVYNGGNTCGISVLTHTWSGAGTDGTCGGNTDDGKKWSCALNWSDSIVPGPLDTVLFDATSTKDSIIDSAFQGTITTLTIGSGYTGTITQQRSFNINGNYAQSAGTFAGNNNNMTVVGTFTLNSGAIFTAPSATLNVYSTFTLNSGSTFNHNNGTVNFGTANTTTLSCNSATFNLVTLKYPGTGEIIGTRTIGANCTLPLGNNPVVESNITLNGTFTGSGTYTSLGTLVLSTGSQFNGFTGLDSIQGPLGTGAGLSLTLGNGITLNASNYNPFVLRGSFIQNAGSTFVAPSSMTVGGIFRINEPNNFNANNGTIHLVDPFDPISFSNGFSWCYDTNVLNKVIFENVTTQKYFEGFSGTSSCNLPLGNNPTISAGGLVVGASIFPAKLTGTGTLTINGPILHSSVGTISNFDNVIFNNTYTYVTPIFTNVGKLTFNNSQTFSTTFNGSQVAEVDSNTNLNITGGTFTAPTLLKLYGSFNRTGGTFVHNNGTVEFAGTGNKTIAGNTTFNNLKYLSSNSPSLSFTNSSTQVVDGTLTLKGQTGNHLDLKSTTPGSTWNINAFGTRDIQYVRVSDSNASSSPITVGCDSIDDGNNIGWNFTGSCSPAISNLGPAALVNGSTTNNDQPTFTFDISDPDSWDTVKYSIQIDDNSDFSSPEVDYTSGFFAQGNFSFTVGQVAGTGSYTTGTSGQTLVNGNYYWRVKAIDFENHDSGYSTANSGNTAFVLDTSFVETPGSEANAVTLGIIGGVKNNSNSTSLTYYLTSQKVTISGTALAGSTVFFTYYGHSYSVTTDSNGYFSITLTLPFGTTYLSYYFVDSDGNKSEVKYLTLIIGCSNFTDSLKALYCPSNPLSPSPIVVPEGGSPNLPDTGTNATKSTSGRLLLLLIPFLVLIVLAAIAELKERSRKKH